MPAKWLRDLDVHPREITVEDENTRLTRRGNRLTPEEALWVRKEDEAIKSGVTESIRKEGIVNPVKVMGGRSPMIKNGFHRVASVDPLQMVPITYDLDAQDVMGLPAHVHRENETSRFSEEEWD